MMRNNTLQIFSKSNIESETLDISGMDIYGFVDFSDFINTQEIKCNNNSINKIYGVLPNVKVFIIYQNKIDNLDNLVDGLEYLDCHSNNLIELNNLPSTLIKLDCSKNKIKLLDNLPQNLITLNCSHNPISSFENLPFSIQVLNCSYTLITNLDYLPEIIELNAKCNSKLTNLSNLPSSLEKLIFDNEISILPLPNKLKEVYAPTKCMNLNNMISKKYKSSKKIFVIYKNNKIKKIYYNYIKYIMDNFIIILILILIVIYIFGNKENFDSNNLNQPSGLYNYFFESFMNPYPLPLNKFFSNDIQGNPQV